MVSLLLDKEALKVQKKIFETVLVQELLAEVYFIQAQIGGRAEAREGFKEKMIGGITAIFSKSLSVVALSTAVAAPYVSMGAGIGVELVELTGDKLSEWVGKSDENKRFTLGDFFFAEDKDKLETYFRQLAKAASLRYEYQIGVLLSDKPNEGAIPFARIGARRIIEYLCRIAYQVANENQNQFNALPLDIDLLLDGLIQGRSGKWIDGFKNNALKSRGGEIKDLTVEGAFSRSAMRIMPRGQLSKKDAIIYHRKVTLHRQQEKDKAYDWGRVKYQGDEESKGPKYGFMVVTEATTKRYGYHPSKGGAAFTDSINQRFSDYPTVKIVDANDVLEYNNQIVAGNTGSFIEFIKNKYEKTNYRIDSVWVRDADFSDEHLQGGNYEEVDFSSCHFNNTILEDCNFARANFSFIAATGLICKQKVIFDQADFSFADLQKSHFSEVSCVGTYWVGANLQGLTTETEENTLLTMLQTQQEQQAQLAEQAREAFLQLQQEVNDKYQTISTQLATTDAKVQEEADKLKALAQTVCEEQIDFKHYQVYLEQQLNELRVTLSTYGEQQTTVAEQQQKVQQQIIDVQVAQEKYDGLLEKLHAQLNDSSALNESSLQSINQDFSQQYHDLRKELYEEINHLKERVNTMEKNLGEAAGKRGRIFTSRVATAQVPGANAVNLLGKDAYDPARTQEMSFYMKEAKDGDAVHIDGALANAPGSNAYMVPPEVTPAQTSFVQALQTNVYNPPVAGQQSFVVPNKEGVEPLQQKQKDQHFKGGKMKQKK